MLTRRQTLALGMALLALPSLAAAQEARPGRANPMPEALRKALERDPNAPVLGNPKGDITLTEFFDYNCPHCRKMVPTIQKAIAADPQLRVVFREWPVFGEGSDFAARASLAALRQGKYWPLHTALMAMRERATEASVMRAVRKLGLDEARLRRDMDSAAVLDHIATSAELGDHMGLIGTPTLIVGDEASFGEIDLAELQRMIARGRKALGR